MFRALNNLWLLYCHERSRGLYDNALAIACALGDDLVQAHCLRLINLIEPHGEFSEYCLRKAAAIFHDRQCFDHSAYCVNNYLLRRILSGSESVFDDYLRLLNDSVAHIEGARGLSIIYNNAGVAGMLEGRYSEAVEVLDNGRRAPGPELTRVGIIANLLMAKQLDDQTITDHDILRCLAMYRDIDVRYTYQRANILYNLLALSSGYLGAKEALTEEIRRFDLDNREDFIQDDGSFRILLSATGRGQKLDETTLNRRQRFTYRHGFLPIVHHTWL
jgi:hypothetical protein